MAATPLDLPFTAPQAGTYFVGQYYKVLQQQPDFVHHFYTDASTMVRVDGTIREIASAVLKIHTLVMSLNYTGVEIKAAYSLESWNGGVLVMVSGSVHLKNLNVRRKFVQTFFLAPQETGYLVLNDIFHFTDDEDQILQLPVTYLAHHDCTLNASAGGGDKGACKTSTPTGPVFGQPLVLPSPAGFMFGSTAPSPSPLTSPFQFRGQKNPVTPQNPSPFQASSSLDFGAGGSFSLGSTAGGDKGARKIFLTSRRKKK